MTENRNHTDRGRIHSHISRSRFLHLEDALTIGKIRLFAGEYTQGQGAKATAFHYLDLDDARVLFSDLAWGKAVTFTEFKGTVPARAPRIAGRGTDNGEGLSRATARGPQSRVLKIKTADKVWLEIQNGPGEVVGQGAIKPAGDPTAAVSVPLTIWEARVLALAALAYIRAWESKHLLDVLAAGQSAEAPAAA